MNNNKANKLLAYYNKGSTYEECHRKYYQKNKEKINEKIRNGTYKTDRNKTYKTIRSMLLKEFNSKCSRCGFSDIRALQIDHINGSGSQERRKHKTTYQMYKHYLDNPNLIKENLQVLCANCNWIKRVENREVRKV